MAIHGFSTINKDLKTEIYAKQEEWLGRKVDEYWDAKYDNLKVVWI